MKKLGTIKEAQKEALEKEFAGLNFGRYVAEAAAAIADAKFKSQEIETVVSLCMKIHQRYEDFMEALFSSFKKKFTLSKIADDPAKHKIDLKIISELTVLGVFMDKQGLGILHHEINYVSSFHLFRMRTYLPDAAQKNDNLFPQETTKNVLENLPIDYIEGSHEIARAVVSSVNNFVVLLESADKLEGKSTN